MAQSDPSSRSDIGGLLPHLLEQRHNCQHGDGQDGHREDGLGNHVGAEGRYAASRQDFLEKKYLVCFLFCIASSWVSSATLNSLSPCIRNQPGDLLTETHEIIMAPTADHARQGRVEQQHRGRLSTSWTGGWFFLLRVRCRDAPIDGEHESTLSKRDQFLVAVETHDTSRRRIEQEDQGRLSAPGASDRLRMSSGLIRFVRFVERHGGPTCLNHERRVSFLWPYRWRFGSPRRRPRLFPSRPWPVPRHRDSLLSR